MGEAEELGNKLIQHTDSWTSLESDRRKGSIEQSNTDMRCFYVGCAWVYLQPRAVIARPPPGD